LSFSNASEVAESGVMPSGTLFLIATPIGNLEDISLRALRVLREADLIACEDTRRTAKLLNHYGIDTARQSYHEHNEASRTPRLIQMLREGKNIALATDAGTPLLSDPGHTLVSACRKEGIPVSPIPGPSAAIAALVASGFSTDCFLFAGFLPPRSALRREKLSDLAPLPYTLIFYEAPHRLLVTLADMIAVLGPRRACLARELTKVHEEWLHGTLTEILESLSSRPKIQGEATLLVEPGEPPKTPVAWPESVREHLEAEMAKGGMTQKEALKTVARQRGITRREAYNLLLAEKPH
jgi:16S rRNA (cytidine1402-2'-O)-methyltransferase